MAYLNLPEKLSTMEQQLRTMYLYYLNKGLNLSEPMYGNSIIELKNQYKSDNTDDPLFFLNGYEYSSGTIAMSEASSFFNQNDVSVYRHTRYCPVPFHSHEYFEIMCVVKGHCAVYIGNQPVELETGDTIIAPPFVAHTISAFNDDCIVYNLSVRFSTVQSKFTNLFSTKHLISDMFNRTINKCANSYFLIFRAGDYYLGDNKFGDLIAEVENYDDYSAGILNILTSAFLFDLLRKFSDTATKIKVYGESKIELALIKYITENMDTVTLTDLGKKFSYSNRQISRIIKEKTGLSYSELVNKIRVENVAKMLVITDLPISRIMETSGISSPSYFHKLFREYFGETPLEYRNSRLNISCSKINSIQ